MAERYGDLQRPTLIETGIVQSNAGAAAHRLAQSFKEFEGLAGEKAGILQGQRGARDGAAAGASGDPALRGGLRAQTKYGQAYNNAALRSYAIKSEADAEETAAGLEVEAGTDPEAFRVRFGKVRDEVLKTAAPDARPILTEIYNRRLSAGVERLTFAQAKEVRAEQRATTAEGISRGVDKIAQLRASDDPAAMEELGEEEAKLRLLIDGAQADGTLSSTEAVVLRRDSARSIIKKTVAARFAKEFDDPYGDPIGFIEDLREANETSQSLPPDEEQKLMDDLMAQLRERNALRAARRSASDAAQQLRYEEGDRTATAALFSGELTVPGLQKMVEDGNLEPSVARTLYNELTAGDTVNGRSDPSALFRARVNLLDLTEDDIRTNRLLSWKDRGDLILERRDAANTWRGTQQAKEAAERIDRALGILPGTPLQSLDEPELRQRDEALSRWYDSVDALPVNERQGQVLVKADEIIKTVIVDTAANEAEMIRQRMRSAQSLFDRKSSPSKQEKTDHDKFMSEQERLLKEAQGRAGR